MASRTVSTRPMIPTRPAGSALRAPSGRSVTPWALGALIAALGACNVMTGADELDASGSGADCVDDDGDGYGSGCQRGPDCDDLDAMIHDGCDISIDGNGNTGGGGTTVCLGDGEFACPPPGECTPEAKELCTTACGSNGTRSCSKEGTWGACTPPAEVCGNGVDDDCDGKVDGLDPDCAECTPEAKELCTTACGSNGTRSCSQEGTWGACTPPAEVCGNGVDDDCDGKVDSLDPDCPPPPPPCLTGNAKCSGENGSDGHCNDPSDPANTNGSRCSPGFNTYGCDPIAFQGWCNSSTGQAYWEQWVYHQMIKPLINSGCTLSCTGGIGDVCKVPHPYWSYSCAESCSDTYCTTPLVVSRDPDAPVAFRSTEHSFSLSVSAGGARHDWPTAATPWLVVDRNGNGRIDDGGELFGSATRLADARTATNGFEALAELDDNHDGIVDAADAGWARLGLWGDDDNDGVSSARELRSLDSFGIESIEVRYHVEVRCDQRGNCERERARIHWRDGSGQLRTGAVIDVHLRSRSEVCE